MPKPWIVLAGGLVLATAPSAGGRTPGDGPLTLVEARRLALARNQDFRIAQAQVEAALGQLKIARQFPNPTLGLSTADINTDGKPNGTILGNGLLDRSYDSIASLSQLFLVAKEA